MKKPSELFENGCRMSAAPRLFLKNTDVYGKTAAVCLKVGKLYQKIMACNFSKFC